MPPLAWLRSITGTENMRVDKYEEMENFVWKIVKENV